MASDTDLDKIRERIDMVELVSSQTRLKKAGARYKGLCVFHNEKTPSFTVDAERKLWHCFGCGEGGDMFSFVMKTENVEFQDAVRILANRAGVELEPFRGETSTRSRDRQVIQKINNYTAQYFVKVLRHETHGAPFRAYLEKRAMPGELVDAYGIGAATASWDALIRALGKKGISAEDIEKAGLAIVRDDGRAHVRFRNRLMFQLRNIVGEIVGFAGRKMNDEDYGGKYVNTPETALFDKGKLLYNLDRAKKCVKDESLILVEGYMDVLGLVRAGIDNTVASMGTALTAHQCDMLRRYCARVYLSYDSDIAGDAAAVRGIELLIERGLDIRVVTMPQGQDPDDIVREGGPEAFQACLDNATDYFTYFLNRSMEKHGTSEARGLRDIILDVAPLIRKSNNPVLQSDQVRHTAQTLGVDEKKVSSIMTQSREPSRGGGDAGFDMSVRMLTGATVVEKKVVESLFSGTGAAAKILERLDASYFTDKKLKALFGYCKKYSAEKGGFRPDDFLNDTHPQDIVAMISSVSLVGGSQPADPARFLADLLDKFMTDFKKRRLAQLSELIRRAEKEGDREGVNRFAQEMMSLKKEIV